MPEYPDLSALGVEARASALLTVFAESENAQKGAIADALVLASEQTAEHVGVRGGFMGPFDINARATIEQMGFAAAEISNQFHNERNALGFVGCCAYAAIAAICFSRAGHYKDDPSSTKIAEMAVKLYGLAKAAREN
jgi:hypothetical protein